MRYSENFQGLFSCQTQERKNLPLVWRGKTLIYVGGVGSEVREQVDDDGTPRYRIEFIKNPGLFS